MRIAVMHRVIVPLTLALVLAGGGTPWSAAAGATAQPTAQASVSLSFSGATLLIELDTPEPATTWLAQDHGTTIVVDTTAQLEPASVPVHARGIARVAIAPRPGGGSRITISLDRPMMAELRTALQAATRAIVAIAPEAMPPGPGRGGGSGAAVSQPAPAASPPSAPTSPAFPLPPGGPMQGVALPTSGSTITLRPGEGELVSTPGLQRVAVSNPAVAEVVTVSTDQLLIEAHKDGLTSLWVWLDGSGVYQYTVEVRAPATETDRQRLVHVLEQAAGDQPVHIAWVGNALVLSGTVPTQVVHDQMTAMAQAAVKGIDNATVVDQIAVEHPIQYKIEVRIVELQNSAFKDVGINWGMFWQGVVQQTTTLPNGTSTTTFVPTPSGAPCQLNLPPAGGVGGPGATTGSNPQGCFALPELFLFGITSGGVTLLNGAQFFAQLIPLIRNGDANVLAAPNVVTLAGKEASLVIGGQIPLPGSNGQITYRPYGVVLKFTPTPNGDNGLYLTLDASYSQPDFVHTIGVQGSTLPTLQDRHVTTQLSLTSKQTFAIGGMISHITSQQLDKVPFLGDLPVLGALFRHSSFQENKSEVMFFITPEVMN